MESQEVCVSVAAVLRLILSSCLCFVSGVFLHPDIYNLQKADAV